MSTHGRIVAFTNALLIAGFCYHALAVTYAGLLPNESELSRRVKPLFHDYLDVTGNANDWSMFVDRPAFRSFHVTAAARTADGQTHRFGPLLPDLAEYDGSMRALKLFVKLAKKSGNEARAQYLSALKQTLTRERGIAAAEVWLEYEVEVFNSTSEVRKTGVIAEKRSYQRGR